MERGSLQGKFVRVGPSQQALIQEGWCPYGEGHTGRRPREAGAETGGRRPPAPGRPPRGWARQEGGSLDPLGSVAPDPVTSDLRAPDRELAVPTWEAEPGVGLGRPLGKQLVGQQDKGGWRGPRGTLATS